MIRISRRLERLLALGLDVSKGHEKVSDFLWFLFPLYEIEEEFFELDREREAVPRACVCEILLRDFGECFRVHGSLG